MPDWLKELFVVAYRNKDAATVVKLNRIFYTGDIYEQFGDL